MAGLSQMTRAARVIFAPVCCLAASCLHLIPVLLVIFWQGPFALQPQRKPRTFSCVPEYNPFPGVEKPWPCNMRTTLRWDGSGNIYEARLLGAFRFLGPVSVIKETLSAGGYATSYDGSGLVYPYGVAVDGDGNVYIGDTGNSRRVLEGNTVGRRLYPERCRMRMHQTAWE